MNNLLNELIYTVDGCMVQKTPRVDIAKIYAKTFDTALLIMLQNFWKNSHENLNV